MLYLAWLRTCCILHLGDQLCISNYSLFVQCIYSTYPGLAWGLAVWIRARATQCGREVCTVCVCWQLCSTIPTLLLWNQQGSWECSQLAMLEHYTIYNAASCGFNCGPNQIRLIDKGHAQIALDVSVDVSDVSHGLWCLVQFLRMF